MQLEAYVHEDEAGQQACAHKPRAAILCSAQGTTRQTCRIHPSRQSRSEASAAASWLKMAIPLMEREQMYVNSCISYKHMRYKEKKRLVFDGNTLQNVF